MGPTSYYAPDRRWATLAGGGVSAATVTPDA
jgi:hypothetical protein